MAGRGVRVPKGAEFRGRMEGKCGVMIRQLQREISDASRSPQAICNLSAWLIVQEAALNDLERHIEELDHHSAEGWNTTEMTIEVRLMRRQLASIRERMEKTRIARSRTPIKDYPARSESPFSVSIAKRQLGTEEGVGRRLADIVPTREGPVFPQRNPLQDSDELFSTHSDPLKTQELGLKSTQNPLDLFGTGVAEMSQEFRKGKESDTALGTERPTSRSGVMTERRFDGAELDDGRNRHFLQFELQLAEESRAKRDLSEKLSKEREQNTALMDRTEKLEYELTTAMGDIARKEKEIAQLQSEKSTMEANFRQKRANLKAKRRETKSELAETRSKLQQLEQRNKQLEGENAVLQASLSSANLERCAPASVEKAKSCQHYIEELAYATDLVKELERQLESTAGQNERIKVLEDALYVQESRIQSAASRQKPASSISEELEAALGRNKQLEAELVDLKRPASKNLDESHLSLFESQIEGIHAELQSLLEYNSTLQERDRRLSHELKVAEKAKEAMAVELREAKSRIKDLEREVKMTESAVQSLIELQRREVEELKVEESKAKTVSHRLQMLEEIQLMIRAKRAKGGETFPFS